MQKFPRGSSEIVVYDVSKTYRSSVDVMLCSN